MTATRWKTSARAILGRPTMTGLAMGLGRLRQAIAPKFPPVYPSGHYYSPVPDLLRVREGGPRLFRRDRRECLGIDLREAEQLALLDRLAESYRDQPFPEHPGGGGRYHFRNPYFGQGDAIVLQAMLRHFAPRRVIEIGSGFSSAAMLDTHDRFLKDRIRFTFIDPYPDRLRSLLTDDDRARHEVLAVPIQEVDLSIFDGLEEGDILFIDSSHVVKIGSDVGRIVFEILPRLRPGVVVHIHDIFWPFEYPQDWLEAGRAWNEAYLIRAFLQFNPAYRILYFNAFMAAFHRPALEARMPLCLENPGGSLWLSRES